MFIFKFEEGQKVTHTEDGKETEVFITEVNADGTYTIEFYYEGYTIRGLRIEESELKEIE